MSIATAGPIIALMNVQREAAWRWVGRSMAAGAAYDLLFALAILFAHRQAAGLMGLPLPDDPVYLRFIGVFLLLLAGLYALPAVSPRRYQGVVAVASAGRLAGFFYMAGVWWTGHPAAFLWLALGDLAFSALHAVLLLRARRE